MAMTSACESRSKARSSCARGSTSTRTMAATSAGDILSLRSNKRTSLASAWMGSIASFCVIDSSARNSLDSDKRGSISARANATTSDWESLSKARSSLPSACTGSIASRCVMASNVRSSCARDCSGSISARANAITSACESLSNARSSCCTANSSRCMTATAAESSPDGRWPKTLRSCSNSSVFFFVMVVSTVLASSPMANLFSVALTKLRHCVSMSVKSWLSCSCKSLRTPSASIPPLGEAAVRAFT
mmetsp:Transcript_38145/g.89459  ORF Transcript_38145/g.89459 Transcript_38145/m.89459 type:complete len:248 (-) Transcript_38145:868-1611(-)